MNLGAQPSRLRVAAASPGHRIAAGLGKASLKTHAPKTLTRRPLTLPRARSVWSASNLSALSLRRGTVSGSSTPQAARDEDPLWRHHRSFWPRRAGLGQPSILARLARPRP